MISYAYASFLYYLFLFLLLRIFSICKDWLSNIKILKYIIHVSYSIYISCPASRQADMDLITLYMIFLLYLSVNNVIYFNLHVSNCNVFEFEEQSWAVVEYLWYRDRFTCVITETAQLNDYTITMWLQILTTCTFPPLLLRAQCWTHGKWCGWCCLKMGWSSSRERQTTLPKEWSHWRELFWPAPVRTSARGRYGHVTFQY